MTLYDAIIQDAEKTVKNERDNLERILLIEMSAFSPEPLNVFFGGEGGTGKSWIPLQTLKYFPASSKIARRNMSPKTFSHSSDATYDEDRRAQVYNFRGKIVAIYESCNPQLFGELYSLASHDLEEQTTETVDDKVKGGKTTKKMVWLGWPAFIFCMPHLPEGFDDDQFHRRFIILSPLVTLDKIDAALALKDHKYGLGQMMQAVDDEKTRALAQQLEKLINKIMSLDLDAIMPYPLDVFRKQQMIEVSQKAKLQGLAISHALFHYKERYIFTITTKGKTTKVENNIIVELVDIMRAYTLMFDVLNAMVPKQVLTFYDQLKVLVSGEDLTVFTVGDLMKYFAKAGNLKSRTTIYDQVELLAKNSFLIKDQNPDNRRENIYRIDEDAEIMLKQKYLKDANFEHVTPGIDQFIEWLGLAEKTHDTPEKTFKFSRGDKEIFKGNFKELKSWLQKKEIKFHLK